MLHNAGIHAELFVTGVKNRPYDVHRSAQTHGPGRPPKHGEAMTPAERQRLYAAARGRDMAEVAFALKTALAVQSAQAAFVTAYRGTVSGERLRRGFARLLPRDDPDNLMVFFDGLILSGGEK